MARSGSGRGNARRRVRKILDYLLTGMLLFLLLMVAVSLEGPEPEPARGVAIINDGDSITLSGLRVRLRGIDAPEYMQSCTRNGSEYPCGRESRAALQKLVGGRAVSCVGRDTDRYGRLLAVCRVGDVDLNAAQVAAGWAVSFGDYLAEEAQARQKRLGIWAGEFDRPGDWRVRQGDASEPRHLPSGLWDRFRSWLSSLLGRA